VYSKQIIRAESRWIKQKRTLTASSFLFNRKSSVLIKMFNCLVSPNHKASSEKAKTEGHILDIFKSPELNDTHRY
jgi:hypothetical protein